MTQDNVALRLLSRHFVSLTWLDCTPCPHANANHHNRTPHDASAFVISVSDEWFLVTAGHILKDLHDAKKNGQSLTDFAINDSWCSNKDTLPIPISATDIFENSQYVYEKDIGIDCGYIPLGQHHKKLLEANGIVPAREQEWEKEFSYKYDYFMMLGVPTQLTRMEGAKYIPSLVWINIQAIDADKIPNHMSKRCPRFYGKLDPELACDRTGERLNDIEGMSGGLIIGFRQNEIGELRYWALAIQSSWDRPTRTIAGCPLRILREMIQRRSLPGEASL